MIELVAIVAVVFGRLARRAKQGLSLSIIFPYHVRIKSASGSENVPFTSAAVTASSSCHACPHSFLVDRSIGDEGSVGSMGVTHCE